MHSIPFHLFNPASCGALEMGLDISRKQARDLFFFFFLSPFLEDFWVKSASSSQAKYSAERVFHCEAALGKVS